MNHQLYGMYHGWLQAPQDLDPQRYRTVNFFQRTQNFLTLIGNTNDRVIELQTFNQNEINAVRKNIYHSSIYHTQNTGVGRDVAYDDPRLMIQDQNHNFVHVSITGHNDPGINQFIDKFSIPKRIYIRPQYSLPGQQQQPVLHIFRRGLQIFNQQQKNDVNEIIENNSILFIDFLREICNEVGIQQLYNRIYTSINLVEEIPYGQQQNMDRHFTVFKSMGVSGSSLMDAELNDVEDEERNTYLEYFEERLQGEANPLEELYEFIPDAIDDIQIFCLRNQNVNQTIQQFKNQVLNTLQQQGVFSYWKGQDFQINKLRKYQTFKQQKEEPCLFTVYRKFIQIENLSWQNFLQNQNNNSSLLTIINTGNLSQLIEYFINNKIIEFENIGFFFYDSKRWINYNSNDQLIVLKNHCIVSNIEKVEQLLLDEQRNQKKQYQFKYNQTKRQKKQDKVQRLYFDIETYFDEKTNKLIPYLACFYDKNKFYNFWGIQCINESFQWLKKQSKQFSKVEIWSFNGSKFDYLYYFEILLKQQNVKFYGKFNDLKCIIFENIYFYDIKLIFTNGSLKQQAQAWQIDDQKQDFDISKKNQQFFDENKNDIIKYCEQDCIVLQKIVEKYFQLCTEIQINNEHIFTLSQLSQSIYQQKYQKDILLGESNMGEYKILKSSYYGGMTMNIKKYGQNLYYYDINSSYPSIMVNEFFPLQIIGQIKYKDIYIEEYIDYYLYEIECEFKDNIIITCLPQRKNDGLYYTQKIDKSWRWGKEINFLIKHKQLKYIIVYQYIKYKQGQPFKEYISDIYQRRLDAKKNNRQDLVQFYKLIMNSFYGKFGQRHFSTNQYCLEEQLPLYISNIQDITIKEKKKWKILKNFKLQLKQIEFIREISEGIFNIEYVEDQNINFIGSLVRFASYITACGRIKLMEGIQSVGQENIYYMDTDSIITSKQLDKEFISDNILGKWKLEGEIIEGYFFAPKMYYIKYDDLSENLKAKGIKLNNFIINNKKNSQQEFIEQLIKEQQAEITNLSVFKRNCNNIQVIDQKKQIKLNKTRRKWLENNSFPYHNLLDII